MNLTIFNQLDFLPALREFFKVLQVPIAAVTDKPIAARDILESNYKENESFRLIDEVYFLGMVDDAAFRGGKSLDISQIKSDYDGIVIFGVTLKVREGGRDGGLLPTRSQLAEIARAFNREFCYTPVVVVFRYAGADGEYLAFANTERSKFKRNREGEKAGKVTLLRDIDINNTHSGHKKILADLKIPNAGKDRVDSFDKLYKYWQKVLDVSLLNKQFYKEVSTWYFHACKQVVFPKDAKPDNQESLIRLITRLMFVWFLKEKGLVPDALFDKEDIQSILKSLEPQESTYYKAILQNLFFATLNTEGKREFIKESSGGRNSRYMVHNTFRYQDYFQQPDRVIEDYFADIPFLNGGLFECLDRRDENEPEVRIDGFSNNSKNPLSVPNELFFGELQDVDLNADFGTSRKKYQVRGLVEIFKSYKFTIAENTPFEEDVALDPELLGQVFENLLAAYNPETQTTARKQTGSFYTPREIVNYMVDESLIAYLKYQLLNKNVVFLEVGKRQTDIFGNEYKAGQLTIQEQLNQNPFKGKESELEQKLRQLLSFDDVNPFVGDDAIQKRLIQALDNCKILDPACGSGAFPMGVLQKMVHILAKLDPHNERWKHQQKEREILPVLEDLQQAQKISYEQARDAAVSQLRDRLAQIEADFANNEKDYPRKLFLIENCIYGVDIQPIALQIAKLRCFISLIVEQRVDNSQHNRGILPLPNLETKFVAANSLIRFSDQMNLRSPAVEVLEKELKEVRQKHFTARSKATKDKYRNRDQELRNAIGDLLKGTGLEVALADSLARWNPYNQNTSADFFDAEWMFGIGDGFDIVIGNPPYVRQEQIKELKPFLNKQYECYTGVADLYVYFYEKAIQMLKDNGNIAYISSNKWFKANYGVPLRKYIAENCQIHTITDFGELSVFSAATFPMIFIATKRKVKQQSPIFTQVKSLDPPYPDVEALISQTGKTLPVGAINKSEWMLTNSGVSDILKRMERAGIKLGEYVDGQIYYGIKTGFNKAFIIDDNTRDELIKADPNSTQIIKPLAVGDDVRKWQIRESNQWLIFTKKGMDIKQYPAIEKHLSLYKERLENRAGDSKWFELQASPAEVERFEKPKIIYPDIAKESRFAFDPHQKYINDLVFAIPISDFYLLGILNSSLIWYYLSKNSAVLGDADKGGRLRLKKIYVSKIPIPTATEAEQKAIETLVQKCLEAKGQNVTQWEQEIDAMVARLYGLSDEEMEIIRGNTD
ncbi:Eco57I restriction-modification methylase domain-containing protein [Phormidium tenue]|uniref:site-specific DNA-methyltransferase (adenine-specific) n=1 Tax=Phormidium tenue FACHB-1050 TaxID=2692857 RepID=A0ABR8CJB7_9CYAN|nr:N-6 DNA methylase [Phormidium tenue]MBD2319679.1 Eco57I restriction-modification methylase domain-containing protein [Phormidium tenue FACHB-1050]